MFIIDIISSVIGFFMGVVFGLVGVLMFIVNIILGVFEFVLELIIDVVFFFYEKFYLIPKENRRTKKIDEEIEKRNNLLLEKIERDTINHPIKIDFHFDKLDDRKKNFNAWIKSRPNYKKVYITHGQPNGTTPFYVYCKESKDEILFKLTWS